MQGAGVGVDVLLVHGGRFGREQPMGSYSRVISRVDRITVAVAIAVAVAVAVTGLCQADSVFAQTVVCHFAGGILAHLQTHTRPDRSLMLVYAALAGADVELGGSEVEPGYCVDLPLQLRIDVVAVGISVGVNSIGSIGRALGVGGGRESGEFWEHWLLCIVFIGWVLSVHE